MTTTTSPFGRPQGLPLGSGWVDPGRWEPIVSPFDGALVAEAPVGGAVEVEAALAAAHAARSEVGALPTHERRRILRSSRDAIVANADDLALLLTLETGKPIVDSRTEVARAATTFDVAADEAGRLHGETVALDLLPAGEGLIGYWVRRPVGVVVGITGFNYPLLLAAHKVAPALAAGCPIIVKPSPRTPLATLELIRLLRDAGCPDAAVQMVTGDAKVGDALVRDERTAAVSFTGSAGVGHAIAAAAGSKRVVLELGSNAALIVAADADLDAAAAAVTRGGFYASGQACISVQRVLVAAPVLQPFLERLVPLVVALPVGDPRSEATRVAPLIDDAAAERVTGWIGAAVDAGARLLTGGERDGRVVTPAVVADVPDGQPLWDEEVFGPVVCVRAVPDLDAAVAAVNASRYGLHASVFTRDLGTAFAAAERLEVGGVMINEPPGFRADNMPYGGVKRSGLGREGPRFAIDELTVTRMVVIRP